MIDPESALGNRLYNWKFATAAEAASPLQDSLDHADYEVVLALEKVFGNVGWFDGALGLIVRAAVETLIGVIEE